MKVLVHDGFGLWLCARRLHQGYFVWPHSTSTSAPGAHDTPPALTLSRAQLDALVLGLPWPRLADGGLVWAQSMLFALALPLPVARQGHCIALQSVPVPIGKTMPVRRQRGHGKRGLNK